MRDEERRVKNAKGVGKWNTTLQPLQQQMLDVTAAAAIALAVK